MVRLFMCRAECERLRNPSICALSQPPRRAGATSPARNLIHREKGSRVTCCWKSLCCRGCAPISPCSHGGDCGRWPSGRDCKFQDESVSAFDMGGTACPHSGTKLEFHLVLDREPARGFRATTFAPHSWGKIGVHSQRPFT